MRARSKHWPASDESGVADIDDQAPVVLGCAERIVENAAPSVAGIGVDLAVHGQDRDRAADVEFGAQPRADIAGIAVEKGQSIFAAA
ncbi:hypothetical protein [Nocardia fluminea]|uniref:hypothetical protein n=1 Tax=Nocardia fluminea TaxID=134984 RepID=UPI0033E8F8A9